MAFSNPSRVPRPEPIPIDARAGDHLRYIRETMASAAEFTAVPGWGGVAMGITALAAAYFALQQTTEARWLLVWLLEAGIAWRLRHRRLPPRRIVRIRSFFPVQAESFY